MLDKMLKNLLPATTELSKRWLQLLLVLVILGFGAGIAALLRYTRQAPAKVEQVNLSPLVKVQAVHQQDIQMIVRGYGTVQPKVQAEVVPQVPGKVVQINDNFRIGGFVPAGQALVIIDPRDYELAAQSAEAEVARAEVDLELEMAEAEVARQEWQQLNPAQQPPSALVFREPQIRQARTKLQAAGAQLATAKLNLERTVISLPFDGKVISQTVDLGQYVTVGQPIGKLYSIEAVEIEVPLADSELAWFNVPANPVSVNGGDPTNTGSEVELRANFAGGEHSWQGRVVRTTGQVDTASRLVSVVVEVHEPFKDADGRLPLVPGMFVELLIKGKMLNKAIAVPRYAVHNGNQVWVVRQGRLNIQELRIVREDRDYAYVLSGVEDGEIIVLSSLDMVTNGMQVRTQQTEGLPEEQSR
jgi:multidrug efflux system membrane fusion protein